MSLKSQILEKNIYIAGHNGMVGSAIHRDLEKRGYKNIVTHDRTKLDLIRQNQVEKFFIAEQPEYVVIAAAKVGGIFANNTYRAQFIYENVMIAANIIHAAYENHVEKLLFLGSSCVYPKFALQPLKEEYLLTNSLEVTNEPYAVAKIAAIKMCENYYRQYGCNFFSVMPTNLYGPNDNFNLDSSHVIPALIRKFHIAKSKRHHSVSVWGSGMPYREFLYVEDLADAIHFMLENLSAKYLYSKGISHINIGTGEDLTIEKLANLIAEIVGFNGKIEYDSTKPDGTPRKLLDVNRLHNLGWRHLTSLKEGIEKTYKWFLANFI